jgi:hypothetical protein
MSAKRDECDRGPVLRARYDESDLKEIEEKRHQEDESVGEDEEAQLTVGKGAEQLLDPQLVTARWKTRLNTRAPIWM